MFEGGKEGEGGRYKKQSVGRTLSIGRFYVTLEAGVRLGGKVQHWKGRKKRTKWMVLKRTGNKEVGLNIRTYLLFV